MHYDAIEIDDRPHGIELPVAPYRYLCVEVSGNLRYQSRRHIDAVELAHDLLNVPSGHSLGVEGEYLVVKTCKATMVFRDQLWLESAIAVTWGRELDFA